MNVFELTSQFNINKSISQFDKEGILGHLQICTVTPLPLVIYPIISSPGIGPQHFAKHN